MHWSGFFYVVSRFQLRFGRLERVAIYLLWFPLLHVSCTSLTRLLVAFSWRLTAIICQLWRWCSQVKSASTRAWCSLALDSRFSLLSVISSVLWELDLLLPSVHSCPPCPCFISRQQLILAFPLPCSVGSPLPLALALFRGNSWCLHFAVSHALLSLM